MSAYLEWRKIPSVTEGGKPYFYRGYFGSQWAASVVWNRGVRAYAVEVRGTPDRLVAYVPTVAEGKALAVRSLQGPSAPLVALRRHVTEAIEAGRAEPIVGIPAEPEVRSTSDRQGDEERDQRATGPDRGQEARGAELDTERNTESL